MTNVYSNQLFLFTAWNSQSVYGWGDESDAMQYADRLNADREVNLYGFDLVEDAETIEKVEQDQSGINLYDELTAAAE